MQWTIQKVTFYSRMSLEILFKSIFQVHPCNHLSFRYKIFHFDCMINLYIFYMYGYFAIAEK